VDIQDSIKQDEFDAGCKQVILMAYGPCPPMEPAWHMTRLLSVLTLAALLVCAPVVATVAAAATMPAPSAHDCHSGGQDSVSSDCCCDHGSDGCTESGCQCDAGFTSALVTYTATSLEGERAPLPLQAENRLRQLNSPLIPPPPIILPLRQ